MGDRRPALRRGRGADGGDREGREVRHIGQRLRERGVGAETSDWPSRLRLFRSRRALEVLAGEDEGFLRWLTAPQSRFTVRLHLCPPDCAGAPEADDLVHLRRLQRRSVSDPGWVENLKGSRYGGAPTTCRTVQWSRERGRRRPRSASSGGSHAGRKRGGERVQREQRFLKAKRSFSA